MFYYGMPSFITKARK